MLKEVEEKQVLFTRHELESTADIGILAGQDEPKLRALAESRGLRVAGPLEHAYWNMAVRGVPHYLEIWLPVQGKPDGAAIGNLKTIPRYKCLSAGFTRPIEEIGDGWMALGVKARQEGLQLTAHDREVYRVMDCDDPRNNDIELQMGIQ